MKDSAQFATNEISLKAWIPIIFVSLCLGSSVGYSLGRQAATKASEHNGQEGIGMFGLSYSLGNEDSAKIRSDLLTSQQESRSSYDDNLKESNLKYASDARVSPHSTKGAADQAIPKENFSLEEFKLTADSILQEFKDEKQSEILLSHLLDWSSKDVKSALSYVDTLSGAEGKSYIQDELLRKASQLDPMATLEWISQNVKDSQTNRDLVTSVFVGLAELDVSFARKVIDEFGLDNVPQDAQHAVLEIWSKEDAASAFSWLQSNRGIEENRGLAANILAHYMTQDEVMAGMLIRDLPPGELRSQLSVSYAHQLAKSDITIALDWSNQLPDKAKLSALTNVFDQWVQDDAWQALSYAQSELPEDYRDQIVSDVAMYLASKEPEQLAEILVTLPGSSQAKVAEHVGRFWSSDNITHAREWASGIENPEIRSLAVKGIIDNFMYDDPQAAFSLAESVEDVFVRYELVNAVASHWSSLDKQRAREAVKGSRLDGEEKKSILKIL